VEWLILVGVLVLGVIAGAALVTAKSQARPANVVTPPAPTKKVAQAAPPAKARKSIGNHQHRFELDTPLPDMTCGNNGVPFQQVFRPTYFTAEWTNGALSEVRIWGPRVLKDGGLGSRLLDHCWNRRPVSLDSLPESVADQIRSYESMFS
jgi:exodeoxyribonuclease-3